MHGGTVAQGRAGGVAQLSAPAGNTFPIECLVDAKLTLAGLAKRLEKGLSDD